MIERQILLREAEDLGVHPPVLWRRFSGPELVYVIAVLPSGKTRCWSREPQEDAETFALRVTRDALAGALDHHSEERRTIERFLGRAWLLEGGLKVTPSAQRNLDAFAKLKTDANTSLKGLW